MAARRRASVWRAISHPFWAKGGPTPLELTATLVLLCILSVALVLTWTQGVHRETRIAHDRMMQEIRLAGMNPCTGVGMNGAVTAATSTGITLQYFWPVPQNLDCAASAPTLQTVTYQYDAGTRSLRRQVNGGGFQPLTAQTSGTLTFQYFKCDGAAASVDTQPDRDLIVRVTVVANESFSGGLLSRQLVSNVRIRNTACAGRL